MTHRGMFKLWALCALPWLLAVVFCAVYDHHHTITRLAVAHVAEHGATVDDAETVRTQSSVPSMITAEVVGVALFAVGWSRAAAEYSASAIGFYGLLPVGVTFFLFVAFLPWATRWSAAGNLDDEPDLEF